MFLIVLDIIPLMKKLTTFITNFSSSNTQYNTTNIA